MKKTQFQRLIMASAVLYFYLYLGGGVRGRVFILSKTLNVIPSEKQDYRALLFSSSDLYFLGDLQLAFVLLKRPRKQLSSPNVNGRLSSTPPGRPGSREAQALRQLSLPRSTAGGCHLGVWSRKAARCSRCRLQSGGQGGGG